ncbi:MBL fold metallo-hydrolase [Acholeplasma sp. OttesenSCG-928-E16]|nr:MBL fold metallo-hydrolase [Acholeplasma sp. OttesenSCG-928-E16]
MIKIIRDNMFSNTYILTRFNVCYIVDPSDDYETIIEKVGSKEILGILLTHAHFDHTMLINRFLVPIFLHREDANILFEDDWNGFNSYKINRPYLRKELDLRFIEDQDELPLGDYKIRVYHTPGHTRGSLSFLCNDILISGDTLFKNGVGRYDFYSGSLFDLKRSVVRLIDELDPRTNVFPGHGPSTTIRDEKKCNDYYLKWKKQQRK